MWLARAKDKVLTLFSECPRKGEEGWIASFKDGTFITIGDTSMKKYPNVKWEDDEPVEVILLPFGKAHEAELKTSKIVFDGTPENNPQATAISTEEVRPMPVYASRTRPRASYGQQYCYLWTTKDGKYEIGYKKDVRDDIDNDRHIDGNYYISFTEARDIADMKNEITPPKKTNGNVYRNDLAAVLNRLKKAMNNA